MFEFKKTFGTIYPVLIFFIVDLMLLSLSRALLSLWQNARVAAVDGWLPLFLQGVRIDVSALCWLFAPAVLVGALFIGDNKCGRFLQKILQIYLVAVSTFLLFMEFATPAFIETYDLRPNRLFVEYLVNPKEVFAMLVNGHSIALITASLLTVSAAFGFTRLAKKAGAGLHYHSWKLRAVSFLILASLTFLGARSTLEHRGINPSMVAFSSDPLVNSLVLNSGYSVLFALQQMKDEEQSSEIYGKMSPDEMLAVLKQARGRNNTDYISPQLPTLTANRATYGGKPKNIVIILEESLGAQFIGILGGKPLSPNFDRLAQEGWLFTNLYATGTRSVRGIEAITAGFTPTPARAVVKLPGSQQGFFTIAELLKRQGYHTSFIYGGEKHFDNMAGFFYGNGFEQIIDEQDFAKPKFTATWGVSDEDLFDQTNAAFEQMSKRRQPFFSLVFTSSNHDPFEYPEGRITPYEAPKASRNNAAKYADYAIGYFFDLAKKSDYWKDTVFLVVADHDSRVAGSSLVPIRHFHIPALILGDGIAARKDDRLVSQIDMPTTLLSLAGISGDYPMLGFDLTKPQNPNRALMQYDKTMAYMRGNDVVILRQDKPAEGYEYDSKSFVLTPKKQSDRMKKEALAYALWGSYAYKNKLYRMK